jgi:chloride channel protein, CIC family
VNRPLFSLRRVPVAGVLAEREMGGFLLISALVGVGVGLGAAGLVFLLDTLEDLLGPRLETLFDPIAHGWWDPSRAIVFVIVPLGLFLAWWLAKRFAPEVSGDGVPEAIAALAVHGGRMRGRVGPLKVLATSLTVGLGGSAGREGPIVQIGGAVGSWVSRRFGLGEDQIRSLVAAGAGAGIGAAFNAPIAGMLFALEVILSSFAARHMSSIVIASIAAAITSRLLVGPELALEAGFYRLNSFEELLAYGALAVLVVAVGLAFLWMLDRMEGLAFRHERSFGWKRPVVAGILVAGLIFFEPQLFGTGQRFTNDLLAGRTSEVWWFLILLALGKAVATSLTISSGASGGAFMPSLFMGAALGSGFAQLLGPLWFGSSALQPGAFAVVGMAAMFAVVGRAPLTAILIVFEVTGARDYGLILPLMLVATLATFLAERFHPDSVYTQALRRRGIVLRRQGSVDILDTIDVGRVMAQPRLTVSPQSTLDEVERLMQANRSHGVPVIDEGVLVGVVTTSDLARSQGDGERTVGEVMTPRPVTVTPDTPVSRALERMAALGVGRLPVVDESDPTKLVGIFRREEAVRAYHEALSSRTDGELHRLRLAQRTHPGAGYYDFRIPPGSVADGRKVKEVAWPEGSTLVSVRRGREVLVPAGNTVLHPGDVVTAFGTDVSKNRMIERLNAGADEPTAEVEIAEILGAGNGPDESST